ncbi:restriction endonuclease subunit S [Bacillus mycoides]|uniref:restriction endonuclease subunit S n=1 Tax=Bacillus mycoides TaxID=1405 RepID=UPI002079067B|nr:restriction endonuclease subunit S [Bacillus mycoides]
MSKACCMGYKLSTIMGINEIPKHWEEKEIKYCLKDGSEGIKIGPFGSALKSEMLVDNGYKVYGQENLIKDSFEIGHRFITEEKFRELDVYEIRPGNVLISMMGTIGKCKVVPKDIQRGIMDSHLIRLSFDESVVLSEFAALLIQEAFYINVQLGVNSKGSIMSGLNSSIIKNLKVLIPTLEEQKLILQYINMKMRQLDGLIQNKHDLITLLEEQRQSMITEAVTKGLNTNVKMKDSGVEWIGEIPEHWSVKKIKRLTSVKRGASPRPIDDPKYFDDQGEFAWVRIADVSSSDMYLTNTVQRLSELGSNLSVKMKPGDIFLSIAGTVGKACITKINCCIHDGFVYFPDYKENVKYLYFTFGSGEPYKGLGKMGTQLNLNTDTVGMISIPVPPLEEQNELVEFIESKVNENNNLINSIKEQIQKLKDYRQTLIYEVVTGKIGVRDFEVES